MSKPSSPCASGADEGAGQRGLAAAEIALQEDGDAGPRKERQRSGEGLERLRSGEVKTAGLDASGGEAFVMTGYRRACAAGAGPSTGKVQSTVVPWFTLEMQRHLALMQLDEALDDGEAEAGAAVAARHRARLEALEDAASGIPDRCRGHCRRPRTARVLPRAARPCGWCCPRAEKPMALDRRLVRICSTRLGSAMKLVTSAATSMLRVRSRLSMAAASLSATVSQRGGNVDALEPQLHGAGIDGGEVDDGVDDGLELCRGAADVAGHIPAAWALSGPASPICRPSAKPSTLVSGVRTS